MVYKTTYNWEGTILYQKWWMNSTSIISYIIQIIKKKLNLLNLTIMTGWWF